MKKFKLWLFLALFTSNLVLYSATLSDYKGYLAAPSIFLLMSLSSNDGADFKDSVIIEYLLKEKFSVPYSDLIDKNLKVKKDLLQKYLVSEVPVASDLVGSSMADEAGLDLLSYIKTKTGLSEEAIRQRLLNNLPILETLLLILGQSYADTVNSSLLDKQETLKDFVTTNKLLELLLDKGYTQDQLVLIVSNSHEEVPLNSRPTVITEPISNSLDLDSDSDSDSDSELESSVDDNYQFSKEEYESYMNILKEHDTKAYYNFRSCEMGDYNLCFNKFVDFKGMIVDESQGEPLLFMSSLKDSSMEEQKTKLLEYAKLYNEAYDRYLMSISSEEQELVLNYIKSFAPDLYELFMQANEKGDPVYKDHIVRGKGLAVDCWAADGLPKIIVDNEFLHESEGYQRFGIAHELSHYLLGHVLKSEEVDYRKVNYNFGDLHKASYLAAGYDLPSDEMKLKQNIVSGLKLVPDEKTMFIDFKDTFENSYSRVQEFEADRSAVLNFGVSVEDGINWLKRVQEMRAAAAEMDLGTFNYTHPQEHARIAHLQELARDVELQRRRAPKIFNWKELASSYHAAGECTG